MQTERLGFSAWTWEDLPLARELWGNAQVSRYITASGVFDETAIEARLTLEIANGERLGVQYWPVFELASGSFVGCCGLRPFENETDVFEMGVRLLPAVWGKGFAQEGCAAVLRHAFEVLDAREVVAGHHPKNDASRKMMARLGFAYMKDSFYPPTGLLHPAYVCRRGDRMDK